MTYDFSKEEMVNEIIKCGRDPVYFINNYAKIPHPIDGLIPFKTYDYQTELINEFNNYRFNIILKARQLGISTISAAYIVWLMIFHRDKNVLVAATKFGTAANLVKKVKSIIKYIPKWLRIAKVIVDNRTSFELSNGSQIKASSTTPDAGRSEALSLLVIDEAAHVDGLEDLWTGLYPTLSTGGRCIALSTPNGVGNWFHQAYAEAEEGKNDFHPIKLMWDAHPDRDQEWFDKETKNMSPREIAQELECHFNASGETVFYSDDLERIKKGLCEPKYKTGIDRNFWIWKEYNPEHKYLLVADVARGDGQDFSAFHIINIDTLEQAAEYKGKLTTDIYSNVLFDAGREYGFCLLVVENASVGHSVLEKLIEMEYPNIYYSTKGTHEYVDSYVAESMSNTLAGFSTTRGTRPLIIAKLEEFIRNKLIKINSQRLYNEMMTFVWHNGKPTAMRGYNDDLVMSCAIACWVRDTALIANQRDIEYRKAFLNSIVKSNTVLNTKMSGMRGYDATTDMKEKAKEYLMHDWLIKG